MGDQPTTRVPFRLIGWSLFALFVLGLGVFLYEVFVYGPRCSIRLGHPTIDYISPDGSIVVAVPTPVPFNQFLGGGIGMIGIRPALEGPFEIWHTGSGRLAGPYVPRRDGYYQRHVYSSAGHYLAVLESYEPDRPREENYAEYLHLVDLRENRAKEILLKRPIRPMVPSAVHFSPQERFVLVHHDMKGPILFKTATAEMVCTLPSASEFVGFVPDESLMVFMSADVEKSTLHVWDVRSHNVVFTLAGTKDAVLSPDGRRIAAVQTGSLVLIDLSTFQVSHFRKALETEPIFQFSPDGRTLVVLHEKIELWDVIGRTQRQSDVEKIACGLIPKLVFSPDSTLLSIVHLDMAEAMISVCDVSSSSRIWSKKIETPNCQARFTVDSDVLFLDDSEVGSKLEDVQARTGKPLNLVSSAGWLAKFTPDNRYVTLSTAHPRSPRFLEKALGDWWPYKGPEKIGEVRVLEVSSGQELAKLSGPGIEQAWLSDDAHTLITKEKEGDQYYLRCFDLPLGEPPRWIIGLQFGLVVAAVGVSWWWRRRGKSVQAGMP